MGPIASLFRLRRFAYMETISERENTLERMKKEGGDQSEPEAVAVATGSAIAWTLSVFIIVRDSPRPGRYRFRF